MSNAKRFIPLIIGVLALASVAVYFLIQRRPSAPVAPPEPVKVEEPTVVAPPRMITLTLDAQQNGIESGQALIFDEGGKAKIVLSLTNAPLDVPQPADVVLGTCASPGVSVFTLAPAVNGGSETKLLPTLDEFLAKSPLAIRVKQSAVEGDIIVACGTLGGQVVESAPSSSLAGSEGASATLMPYMDASGISGTVTIIPVGDTTPLAGDTQVMVQFDGATVDILQPVTMNFGDCTNPLINPDYRISLSPAMNGISLTLLKNKNYWVLSKAGYLGSITVSRSKEEPDSIVACGDIK